MLQSKNKNLHSMKQSSEWNKGKIILMLEKIKIIMRMFMDVKDNNKCEVVDKKAVY
jgi:hypothetical protein